MDFSQEWVLDLVRVLAQKGLEVLGAVLILIGGRVVAGLLRRSVTAALRRRSIDEGLVIFTGKLVYALVIVFAVVSALKAFGVEVTSFVAVLASAGFAVGMALQGSLSNFAAGVLLLLFRPFKVGDVIDAAGVIGSVKAIDLFSTTMATGDNIKIIVPNSKIFGDTIKNYSVYPTRRVELAVGIAYDADIDRARQVILELASQDPRIHAEPAPMVAVTELADSSVNLIVRVWADRTEYWNVRFEFLQRIKEGLDAHGIEIPFPQRVVHTAPAGD